MKIVITGKPGIGKTTVVKKVAGELGKKAIGFYTEEYRDKKGKREGFKIKTLYGEEGILASKKLDSPYRVGSYGVNINKFEKVVIPVLEEALNGNKVVIIDEIGKMELFSEKFIRLVKKLFSSDRDIIATVPVKNVHPVVKWIKDRPDIILIHLDYSNRDKVPEEILKLMEKK
ncbi:nucleoside-triphosphatase [Persephonella hydrogeniphila]|uniref:Nucleoside-triphosphatase SAMN06265182_1207 n=1 Tax=Persephonella hydrogeniphila TaxID=198703 RepID=A0A285NJZ3_9AQUI|nr:NTPase [Persephonella hydrogeniphila]SNZ08196.1 nucleoside-triphosphatase [Persephonella hydrogeniphila]